MRHFKQDYLVGAIEVLILAILIIILITYIRLFSKKRKFLHKNQIKKKLESWIGNGLLDHHPDELRKMRLPKKMLGYLNLQIRRQFVIDELINMRKSFIGEMGANLSILYERFGLKSLSLKKLHSDKWYRRARGIQELYVMEQRDMLDKFHEAINDENEFVRIEAQTGIIHMLGFNGLEFLNNADYYITEWQQLKMLQQLDAYEITPGVDKWIPKWLRSDNESVVLFAIRLTDHYQLYSQHDNVALCLHHTNENIRVQAACSIAQLANEHTADILVRQFPKESFPNKLRLLDALEIITTDKQKPFLSSLLNNESGVIRLKAAQILAVCCRGGLDYLKQKAGENPIRFKGIYLHAQKHIPA